MMTEDTPKTKGGIGIMTITPLNGVQDELPANRSIDAKPTARLACEALRSASSGNFQNNAASMVKTGAGTAAASGLMMAAGLFLRFIKNAELIEHGAST
jgi:hypothetical protein